MPMTTSASIAGFMIIRKLGSGGMGEVYLAEQTSPIRRHVALKVVRRDLDGRDILDRFDSERQILAQMDHENIARVYNAGLTEDGIPWLAMEYIAGEPITTYCDRNGLTIDERLRLMIDVCRGVHHAHQRGVLHRDLKPSNILIALQDGRPVPKIIDFGIAKAFQAHMTNSRPQTAPTVAVGTPTAMPPEQAWSGFGQTNTTSDVYSLGVLLYELLTGCLPIEITGLHPDWLSFARFIFEADRQRPSSCVESRIGPPDRSPWPWSRGFSGSPQVDPGAFELARMRRTDFSSWIRRLQGDLDSICLRAIEPQQSNRYQSASEFYADIQRFLDGYPLLWKSTNFIYIMRKLMKKKAPLFVSILGMFIALAVALAGMSVLYFRAEAMSRRARWENYVANLAQAQSAGNSGNLSSVKARLASCEPRLRGWEWHHLNRLTECSEDSLPTGLLGFAGDLSPDGSVLAGCGLEVVGASRRSALLLVSTVELALIRRMEIDPSLRRGFGLLTFDRQEGEEKFLVWRTQTGQLMGGISGLCEPSYFEDECRDCTATGRSISEQRILASIATDDPRLEQLSSEPRAEVGRVCFSPDGRRLAFSAGQGVPIQICSAPNWEPTQSLNSHIAEIQELGFSRTGRFLAARCVANELEIVVIWDLETGKMIQSLWLRQDLVRGGPSVTAPFLHWSPDSDDLYAGDESGSVLQWSPASSRTALRRDAELSGRYIWVSFTPQGAVMAVDPTGRVQLMDSIAATTTRLFTDIPQRNEFIACFIEGDSLIAAAYSDGSVRLQGSDVDNDPQTSFPAHTSKVSFIEFDRTSRRLYTANQGGEIKSWRLESIYPVRGRNLKALQGADPVLLSGDGRWAFYEHPSVYRSMKAGGYLEHAWYLLRPLDLVGRAGIRMGNNISSPVFRQQPATFAFLETPPSGPTVFKEISLDSLKVARKIAVSGHPSSFHLDPEGTHLLPTGSENGELIVWNLGRGDSTVLLGPRRPASIPVALSSAHVAAACSDSLYVWSLSGAGAPKISRMRRAVSTLEFARGGELLAVGMFGGEIEVRSMKRMRRRILLTGLDQGIRGMAFSSDGKRLVAAGLGGRALLWDTESGSQLLEFAEFYGRPEFSVDDGELRDVSERGVRVYGAPPPASIRR